MRLLNCVLCFTLQYQEGQRRRKPYYSSVDLSEVEWEDKDDIVRAKTDYKMRKCDFFCKKAFHIAFQTHCIRICNITFNFFSPQSYQEFQSD